MHYNAPSAVRAFSGLLHAQARLDKERYQRALSAYQQQQAAAEELEAKGFAEDGGAAHQDGGSLPISPSAGEHSPVRTQPGPSRQSKLLRASFAQKLASSTGCCQQQGDGWACSRQGGHAGAGGAAWPADAAAHAAPAARHPALHAAARRDRCRTHPF